MPQQGSRPLLMPQQGSRPLLFKSSATEQPAGLSPMLSVTSSPSLQHATQAQLLFSPQSQKTLSLALCSPSQVGFRTGKIVVVSSHSKEIAEEIHQGQYLDLLTDMAYSAAQGRVAMAGGNCVRVMDVSGTDYQEIKGDAIDLDTSMTVEQVRGAGACRRRGTMEGADGKGRWG